MDQNENRKIGIIAGGGELPRRLVDACIRDKIDFFVIAIRGQAGSDTVAGIEGRYAWMRLGQSGTSIRVLKQQGCTDLVMAGTIRRPSVISLLPDARTMKFILKTGAMSLGDDGLLSAVVKTLEHDEGFRVIGVHDIIPGLLAPAGVIAGKPPGDGEMQSIATAVHAALDLGKKDVGQGAVARGGEIIALEDRDGTDAMLVRVGKGRRHDGKRGGVLVKLVKPGQERRVDLPTIGVGTVINAAHAGLDGIAVEAGGAIIVNSEQVISLANNSGIFIYGIGADELGKMSSAHGNEAGGK